MCRGGAGGGSSPGVHDEGAGGGDVAAEAEEGFERVVHVWAAALAEAAGLPARHVVVALRRGMPEGATGKRKRSAKSCRSREI